MFLLQTVFAWSLLAIFCLAQVIPTAPGPDQSFVSGQSCPMQWHPDITGVWKSLSIDLMSGSNDNMSLVTNVVSGLDGTSLSSFTWTCPKVDPYSAIYFYQFSSQAESVHENPAWTSRFALVSVNGASTAPQYSTQPNGDAIPWGIGRLVSDNADIVSSTTLKSSAAVARPAIASPEVTLDVPPRPTKHTRRFSFST